MSASRPIGPRTCSFWVEIPISAPKPNCSPSVNLVEALTITAAASISRVNRVAAAISLVTMASVWPVPNSTIWAIRRVKIGNHPHGHDHVVVFGPPIVVGGWNHPGGQRAGALHPRGNSTPASRSVRAMDGRNSSATAS